MDLLPLPVDEPEEALPLMPVEPLAPELPLVLPLAMPLELLPLPMEPLLPEPAKPLVDGEEVEAEPDPEAEPDAAVFSFGCPVA